MKMKTYKQVVKERDGYRRILNYMMRNFACQFTENQHKYLHKLLKFEKEKIPRATKEQIYYFINDELNVIEDEEDCLSIDDERYKCGNYFLSKEQAEKAIVKIKQAIEEAHNESR